MKKLRFVIFYILMLVLPTSNFASVVVSSNCHSSDSSSHSMHAGMQDSHASHAYTEDQAAPKINLQINNDHDNCECGCNGDDASCFVTAYSTTALVNAIDIDYMYSANTYFVTTKSIALPPDPQLLFRPPISLS